jgi:hypothetical protein
MDGGWLLLLNIRYWRSTDLGYWRGLHLPLERVGIFDGFVSVLFLQIPCADNGAGAYLAHPTCLALLFISLLGLLTLQFQILALNAIKHHAEANANSTVSASTNQLTAKLNAMAMNSSASYAIDFNNQVVAFQQRVDDEMFGEWLNTTAITLNATLVTFYSEVELGELN